MGLKAGTGRAWLPDSLLALRVTSTANNGLPKWGAGFFLLLEGKKKERSCQESKQLPVLVFERGELQLTVGSPAQHLWMSREKALEAAHCPPYTHLGPHSRAHYLCKLSWAAPLRFPAWAARCSHRASPASMQSAGTGPSVDATEVRLPIGLMAWKSSQWHHRVLAGGRQEGTSRKTQICCMF